MIDYYAPVPPHQVPGGRAQDVPVPQAGREGRVDTEPRGRAPHAVQPAGAGGLERRRGGMGHRGREGRRCAYHTRPAGHPTLGVVARAGRLCARAGCIELSPCPVHIPRRQPFASVPTRPSAAARGYGAAHRGWRAAVLERDPICSWPGCRQPSVAADHIQPIRDGGSRFDLANGQGLCLAHHATKTAHDIHRRGGQNLYEGRS